MALSILTRIWLLFALVLISVASPLPGKGTEGKLDLEETYLVIPQVDYEGAIHYKVNDPLPHLDFEKGAMGASCRKTPSRCYSG